MVVKGQLISKRKSQAEDSPKKRTNEFVFTHGIFKTTLKARNGLSIGINAALLIVPSSYVQPLVGTAWS